MENPIGFLSREPVSCMFNFIYYIFQKYLIDLKQSFNNSQVNVVKWVSLLVYTALK